MKQKEIKEVFGYDVYEKYRYLVREIVGKRFKKYINTTNKFEELESIGWEAIMLAHTGFNKDKDIKIETYVYNYIVYKIQNHLRENKYTVYVPHYIHNNYSVGYNTQAFRALKEKYTKQFKDGKITLEKLESILEDCKEELKFDMEMNKINIIEKKEVNCLIKANENGYNGNENGMASNNNFDEMIGQTEDCAKYFENRDLIKKILLFTFEKKAITKTDLEVLKKFYEDGEKKNGYKKSIEKLRKVVNLNKQFKEDFIEIIK